MNKNIKEVPEVACKIMSQWVLYLPLKIFEAVLVDRHYGAEIFTSQTARFKNLQHMSKLMGATALLSGFCSIDKVFIGTHISLDLLVMLNFLGRGKGRGNALKRPNFGLDLNDLDQII